MTKTILLEQIKDYTFQVYENENKTFLVIPSRPGRIDLKVKMVGEQSSAQILGIFIGKNSDQFSLMTLQDHKKGKSISDLLVKSVLFDSARLTYDGLIKIDKNAQRSNAYQRNENLLLNDQAKVDTRPELEILANDVRCTHGATVGKIDEETLFYLTSRGINRKQAERLIIEGFFQPILERIPDAETRAQIRQKVQALLSEIKFNN